jgi:C1A family cysteine protease
MKQWIYSAGYAVGIFLCFASLLAILLVVRNGNDAPAYSLLPSLDLHHPLMPTSRVVLERDVRDFDLREAATLSRAALPSSVNLWKRAGADVILVDDQGSWGSCTAHAMSYAFQLWCLRTRLIPLARPSRAYWYNYSRILLGDSLNQDLGSTNAATQAVLQRYGWVREESFQYTKANLRTRPSSSVTTAGMKQKITMGKKVQFTNSRSSNLNKLQSSIAAGKSLVLGVYVYSSFMTRSVLRSGLVPMPNRARERLLGGHAICVTGYDNSTRRFAFRNSWGRSAGVLGTFTIPYDYLSDPSLCGDIWEV